MNSSQVDINKEIIERLEKLEKMVKLLKGGKKKHGSN